MTLSDLSLLGINEVTFTITSLVIDFVFVLVAYLFKAIAIYTMAKRRGVSGRWMAWVPFLNYVVLGRLIGRAVIWGLNLKNVGVWVALTAFVSTLLTELLNFGYYVDMISKILNVTITFENAFVTAWANGTSILFTVTYYVNMVVNLANIFFEVSMIFLIFRLYNPERATLYSFLSIFFDFLFGIFLFTLRYREPVDYAGYMRARYDGNYGGYNTDYRRYDGDKKEENDPFPEFRQIEEKSYTPPESEDKNDDFFN